MAMGVVGKPSLLIATPRAGMRGVMTDKPNTEILKSQMLGSFQCIRRFIFKIINLCTYENQK